MSRGQLPEPIEIAKFWKNRKGEAVIVRLSEYEGPVGFVSGLPGRVER
jgi:hypothetical protein